MCSKKSNLTLEYISSEKLFDAFSEAESCVVHSWHPPDSKAYFTRLLYIPHNGKREHIDLIVQCRDVLYLIEVKGRLCDSWDDVEKLRSITEAYSTEDLVQQFKTQGEPFWVVPRSTIEAIAAYETDSRFISENEATPILIAKESGIWPANESGRLLLSKTLFPE